MNSYDPTDPAHERRAMAVFAAQNKRVREEIEARQAIPDDLDLDEAQALLARIPLKQRDGTIMHSAASTLTCHTQTDADRALVASLSPSAQQVYRDTLAGKYRATDPQSPPAPPPPVGMLYSELTTMQKHQLWRSDSAKFERMRKSSEERWLTPEQSAPMFNGVRYEQLAPMARAGLQASDPDLFTLMRTDWIKRGEPIIESD